MRWIVLSNITTTKDITTLTYQDYILASEETTAAQLALLPKPINTLHLGAIPPKLIEAIPDQIAFLVLVRPLTSMGLTELSCLLAKKTIGMVIIADSYDEHHLLNVRAMLAAHSHVKVVLDVTHYNQIMAEFTLNKIADLKPDNKTSLIKESMLKIEQQQLALQQLQLNHEAVKRMLTDEIKKLLTLDTSGRAATWYAELINLRKEIALLKASASQAPFQCPSRPSEDVPFTDKFSYELLVPEEQTAKRYKYKRSSATFFATSSESGDYTEAQLSFTP